MYREMLHRRRTGLDRASGLEWIPDDSPDLVVYRRGDVVVVLNSSGSSYELPGALTDDLVVAWSSGPGHDDPTTVPADTCVWLAPAHRL
jgi:hypothetical protein